MYRITKCIISLMLAVCLGVLLVHGDVLNAQEKTGSSKIRAPIYTDPISLDPAELKHVSDRTICQNVFQGLVTFDITAEPPYPIIPVLAKSYEVSKDAKVITFKLHKGVQFHQGYGELTSEDVVFSLQRHHDPKVISWSKKQLEDVERVEAPDKYTVKIYLRIPSAYTLLRSFAWQNLGFIASKKAVAKLGEKVKNSPIGTGPYYFDRWIPGEKVVLKRFDGYWRTPAKIDEIEFWVIPEEIVALGAVEKGDLDIAEISQVGSYRQAKTIKGIRVEDAKGSARSYFLALNHAMKPLDDIRVRKALAHALNIKGIVEHLGPLVAAFPSPLPSGMFGATDEFYKYDYNLKKAKQLLAEAGYPNGFELRMVYKKYGLFEPFLLEVKNCWRDIVDVKVKLVESALFFKTIKSFKHHVVVYARARLTPDLYAQSYITGSIQNDHNYSNPELDEVIMKARTSTTLEEERKHWREFQRLITEDVVNLTPCEGRALTAVSNRLKGVGILPYRGIWDFEKADID